MAIGIGTKIATLREVYVEDGLGPVPPPVARAKVMKKAPPCPPSASPIYSLIFKERDRHVALDSILFEFRK